MTLRFSPSRGAGSISLSSFLRGPAGPAGSNTVFTSTATGVVPASGGGTANFLRADGSFAVPPVTTAFTSANDNRQSKTADYTIAAGDLPMQFDNTGATGQVNFKLPATPTAGLIAGFYVAVGQIVQVIAPNSDTILVPGIIPGLGGNQAGGALLADAVGSYIVLEAVSTSRWVAKTTQTGNWVMGPQVVAGVGALNAAFILAEGDSITQDFTGSGTWRDYSTQFQDTISATKIKVVDAALAGSTFANVQARQAADIAYVAANPGFSKYIYTLMIGANTPSGEPTYYPTGAATLITDIATLFAALKVGGYTKCIICTMPALFSSDAAAQAWRLDVNARLVAMVPAQADAVVDFGATLTMGETGLPTNYIRWWDNSTHPGSIGHTFMENTYATVINSIIAGAVAPGAPSNITQQWVKDTSVALTWEEPTSGGYFSDYLIEYSVHSAGSWSSFAHTASRANHTVITGLTAATKYDIRVSATGTLGTSSTTTFTTDITLAGLPDTLDNLTFGGPGLVRSASIITTTTNTNEIIPPLLTFSESNRGVVSSPASVGIGITRTMRGKSTGKWYCEFLCTGVNPTFGNLGVIGICDETSIRRIPYTTQIGAFPNSGVFTNVSTVSGFTFVTAVLLTLNIGDRVGIAFDATGKKAWASVNNVFGGAGNPATGVNPVLTWVPAYVIHPVIQISGAFPGDSYIYSGPNTFYTPPSGFSVL